MSRQDKGGAGMIQNRGPPSGFEMSNKISNSGGTDMYIEHPYFYEGKYYANIDGEMIEITKEVAYLTIRLQHKMLHFPNLPYDCPFCPD